VSLYRKKPVIIEARQFDQYSGARELAEWCGGRFFPHEPFGRRGEACAVIEIDTLEGVMTARHRDWVIKGVKGEFYPVRNDIFEQTYEPAGETT
jgi:hypothetical protein